MVNSAIGGVPGCRYEQGLMCVWTIEVQRVCGCWFWLGLYRPRFLWQSKEECLSLGLWIYFHLCNALDSSSHTYAVRVEPICNLAAIHRQRQTHGTLVKRSTSSSLSSKNVYRDRNGPTCDSGSWCFPVIMVAAPESHLWTEGTLSWLHTDLMTHALKVTI